MEFPHNGPNSKYTALFDPNPCFDALRLAFVMEPDLKRVRAELLDIVSCSDGRLACMEKVNAFAEAILHFHESAQVVGEIPPVFKATAWNSYKQVLRRPGYFLDMNEVEIVARALRINLIIVMKVPETRHSSSRLRWCCSMALVYSFC